MKVLDIIYCIIENMKIFPYEFVVFRKLWKPVGLHAFYYYFKFNQIVNIPSTKTLNWQYVCYLLFYLY